jgi:predicted Zn-dependent peptidase
MNNIVVSVAGNITHKKVVELAEELLSNVQSQSQRTWAPVRGGISKQRVNVMKLETNQSHLLLVGRAPEINATDEPAMKLLSTILGSGMSSRLFLNVRESKGLAYTVYMSYSSFIDSGKFEIYAGVNNDKIDEAIRAIHEELQKIQQELVGERELNKAKEQVRGRYIMGLEGNSAVADMQGTQMVLTGKAWVLHETLAKIDKVTPDDILACAKRYLYKDLIRLAMIGPYDKDRIEDFEKIMEEK